MVVKGFDVSFIGPLSSSGDCQISSPAAAAAAVAVVAVDFVAAASVAAASVAVVAPVVE